MKKTFDLAIVTCCYNYGQYIEDWARSLTNMTMYPAVVSIVDNGSTDSSPEAIARAVKILENASIPVVTDRIELSNIGTARNRAVEISGDTEWVQHLDCDDMAMEHMVDDISKLAPNADVIPLGYIRSGDLRAGPNGKKRTYRSSRGESTLKSKAPASGVSPFRRSLWKQSPYKEDMIGGWDTALWIGFAHLNARFVATKRPGFYYRQHRDSIFNVRRKNSRLAAKVGPRLQNLRRAVSGVSVLIPWKTDHGMRDEVLQWVMDRYQSVAPDWEIVIGTCKGEWRKGEAIQDALDQSSGEFLVIADADCIVSQEGLEEAVELVREGAPWVIPHTMVHRLDEMSTEAILSQNPGEAVIEGKLHRKAYEGFAGGGMLVIERSKYQSSKGLPYQFKGWGAEDETLALILDTLVGPHVRLSHDLWHMWHPPGARVKDPRYKANRVLFRRFLAVQGQPETMWSLINDLDSGAPLVDNRVTMIALMDFMIGTRPIKKDQTFKCTEEEARRFSSRKDRVAHRLTTEKIHEMREDSKARTLLIRAEQQRRNEEARQEKDLAQRRLAMAGNKTKARNTVVTGQT